MFSDFIISFNLNMYISFNLNILKIPIYARVDYNEIVHEFLSFIARRINRHIMFVQTYTLLNITLSFNIILKVI